MSASGPTPGQIIRKGSYWRSSDQRRIYRFKCLRCGGGFSNATLEPFHWEKKRHLNESFRKLYCSLVSMRRIAKLLSINRKTVARKVESMGSLALERQGEYIRERQEKGELVHNLQFDEMESFVHTKCLPVSIPLIVEEGSRKILGFRVCSMPAKGPLAAISLKKYGPRADDRKETARSLFKELAPLIAPDAKITTDQKSAYPRWFRPFLPRATHVAVKGRRSCLVGQGELKRIGRDPIFDLNHTAAMIRANVNRLIRRTWCTSKRMDRLAAHIALYVEYHNFELTHPS